MNALKKYALPASLIGGGLIVLALVLGLIGAFRGPTAGALKVQATAVATQASVDKAEILKAIQQAQGWSDADKQWMTTLVTTDDDFTQLDMDTILTAINDSSLTADEIRQIVAEEIAKAKLAPPAAPAAAPTATADAQPGSPGWANLPNGRQVWLGPGNNAAVHIEFVSTAPDVAEAKIGVDGGQALFAFAAMGGNARDCTVAPTPMRDSLILSCPVTTVHFAVSQDGEVVTVTAPQFGTSFLSFSEVATLLRQGQINQTGLWGPKAGFFLAWVSTESISGLYVP